MSKSAFEKWWIKNGQDIVTLSREELAWLAALKWALRQKQVFATTEGDLINIDPDKINAEIKKVEEGK